MEWKDFRWVVSLGIAFVVSLFGFCCGGVQAQVVPKIYELTLMDNSVTTGCTTVPSGVSIMELDQGSGVIDLSQKGPCWSVMLSNIAASQAQQASGGSPQYLTEMTFNVYAEWSLDQTDWSNGRKIYFFKDTPMGGASPYLVSQKLPSHGFIRWNFGTSGGTAFDCAKFIAIGGSNQECLEFRPNPNSGTSLYGVNANQVTTIYVPDGVHEFDVGTPDTAGTLYMNYDGTNPTVGGAQFVIEYNLPYIFDVAKSGVSVIKVISDSATTASATPRY